LYVNPNGTNDIALRTIYHWPSAISPHLAAVENNKIPPTDSEIIKSVRREIKFFLSSESSKTDESLKGIMKPKFLVAETAGGALSPGPSKTLQADLYRPLRLPIILVGDAKLGGNIH
jgi:dethiobiotin synthetase/adenosylmethionine--8-amino-7-oxononanoate aminotransferase